MYPLYFGYILLDFSTLWDLVHRTPSTWAAFSHLWICAHLPRPSFPWLPHLKSSALLWITSALWITSSLWSLNTKTWICVCVCVCVHVPYPSGPPQRGIRSRAQHDVLPPASLQHTHCEGRAVITLNVETLRKLNFWEVGHTSPSSSWVNPPKDLSMSTQETEEEEGSEWKDEFLPFLKNI